jgi:hypothetical protein
VVLPEDGDAIAADPVVTAPPAGFASDGDINAGNAKSMHALEATRHAPRNDTDDFNKVREVAATGICIRSCPAED